MSGNAQKTPFMDSLLRVAEGASEAVQQLIGRAPPASVIELVGGTSTIVKVKVEIESIYTLPPITCPVVGPEFLRFPLTEGVKGVLLSSDYYLGGMSGLGGGTARLTRMTNLSSCVFFPIGNKDFQDVEDPGKSELYGEDGVILKSRSGAIKLVLDNATGLKIIWNGQELMTFGANGVSIMYQGKGINILADGTRVDGVNFLPHEHTGVQTGASNTGPVNP